MASKQFLKILIGIYNSKAHQLSRMRIHMQSNFRQFVRSTSNRVGLWSRSQLGVAHLVYLIFSSWFDSISIM